MKVLLMLFTGAFGVTSLVFSLVSKPSNNTLLYLLIIYFIVVLTICLSLWKIIRSSLKERGDGSHDFEVDYTR